MYLPEKLKADGAIYPQKAFEVSHEVLGFGFQQEVSRRRQPGPGWGSLGPEGFIKQFLRKFSCLALCEKLANMYRELAMLQT